MDWKEFFKPNWSKVKLAALLIIFNFSVSFISDFASNFLVPPSFYQAFNDTIGNVTEQVNPSTEFLLSLSLLIIGEFLILVLVSYVFACIIFSLFEKKGRK